MCADKDPVVVTDKDDAWQLRQTVATRACVVMGIVG